MERNSNDESRRKTSEPDAAPLTPARAEDYRETPRGITGYISVREDAEAYNMNHKNRGKCLILNNEVFNEPSSNRPGSTIDVERIEKTFGTLGFDVVVYNNPTSTKIFDIVKQETQYDHSDNDCLCIFVLTHGREHKNIVYLSAKDEYYPSNRIWEPFTGEKCPTLAGKPKLFFYVACRGSMLDSGVTLLRKPCELQLDGESNISRLPTHSDVLIAYSTTSGFVSWDETNEGTYYIKCLCSVLDQYATKGTDLLKMLTITARKVATTYRSKSSSRLFNNKTQIPSMTSMLIRDLYFSPIKRVEYNFDYRSTAAIILYVILLSFFVMTITAYYTNIN